ncbi:MAG: hypothetical protein DRG63_02405 [Deltaproteobacteria bacterium]|nr:MAG: hypothetical protein DRG63_02405 [Deltaproteobacteria bacterium]
MHALLQRRNFQNMLEELHDIVEQIIAQYKPEKVILFGSASRGESGPQSDVDLLIIKRDTPHFGADRIRQLSKMIKRNIPVDFLIYRPDEL